LALNDIQLFIATHSLFLLRELDILLQASDFQSIPACFFGLHLTEDGVHVKQGNTVDDIGQITALEEELSQSNRYLDLG
jgi:hypothetical protein